MIEFILGGARSGKSSFAEKRMLNLQKEKQPLIYIATAQANDEEMSARIEHHQALRKQYHQTWELIECPLSLGKTLKALEDKYKDASTPLVLIDCLTLWLSNALCSQQANWPALRREFIEALQSSSLHLFIVSNEVGHGIVPLGELSRNFVDESGRLHQDIAQLASKVDFIMAGLPLSLKNETPSIGNKQEVSEV